MSKWWIVMAVALAAFVPTARAGETFEYPEGDPAFSIRFPGSWTAEVNDQDALEALSGDETVYLVLWEVENLDNLEDEMTATAEQMLSDVEFDDADEELTNKYGVKFWLKHGDGVEKESEAEVQFTIAVFGPSENRAFVVLYTIEKETATDESKRQFVNIMESISPVEAEEEKESEEAEE
ncbi:MAG TPA: hypothetical protein P5567_10375 [Kiritimatiellia bacterium]|nr:hypothetical protein [Kiritimatiellia bacterium]HRZ12844.1 hypothetical protein [Kiritimatiellia bacterium]HSA18204.1 hypothetical protein [Kiritimatiellia bacterium]